MAARHPAIEKWPQKNRSTFGCGIRYEGVLSTGVNCTPSKAGCKS